MPDGQGWRSRPYAPPTGAALIHLDDLPAGAARELRFGVGRMAFSLLVARVEGRAVAFVNRCPHFSLLQGPGFRP